MGAAGSGAAYFPGCGGGMFQKGAKCQHINEGVECALQMLVMWSFLTMLVMVWFNNRSKHRLVSKQYK